MWKETLLRGVFLLAGSSADVATGMGLGLGLGSGLGLRSSNTTLLTSSQERGESDFSNVWSF